MGRRPPRAIGPGCPRPRAPGGPIPPALRLLLLVAFAASGLATLIYEIVWIKHLVYLFGITWHAITAVVAAFMGGIAGGALLAGRRADALRRPLLAYALLELVIAAWGLGFPAALAAVAALYHRAHDLADLGFNAHVALRLALSAALLLPPTLAMGATLPVLARAVVRTADGLGRGVGALAGLNTLGAALGCALTGFWALPELGLTRTGQVGVALNVLAAVLAAAVARGLPAAPAAVPAEGPAEGPAAEGPAQVPAEGPPLPVGALLAAGFAAIAYEILWTRVAALFHPNAHTLLFSLVLTIFLVGSGLGSLTVAWAGPRLPARPAFAAVQAASALGAWALPWALRAAREAQGWGWYAAWEPARVWMDLYLSAGEVILLAVAVGLPGFASGAALPLGARLAVRRLPALGEGVGSVSFFTTVGGIAGSLVTGVWLMPWVGVKTGLYVLGGLQLAGAAWLGGGRRLKLAGLGALLVGAGLSRALPDWVFLNIPVAHEVEFYRDGRSTTDAVVQVVQDGRWERMLFANGEFVSAGAIGVWLAMELNPKPDDMLILAFDTGASAAEAVEDPANREVEAADISDVQPHIAPWFHEQNRGVMQHPRFRMVPNDGRNHLLTRRGRYGVIFNGVAAYSAYLELTTREFFGLCRDRLLPDGLYLHKIHPHLLTPEGFRRTLTTFAEVFPGASLWRSRVSSVLLLIGWAEPGALDWPTWAAGVAARGQLDPLDIAAMQLLDADGMRALAEGAPAFIDDRPARLSRTITLVDTGSDFLARAPGVRYTTYDREIDALIAGALSPPGAAFSGVPAEAAAEIGARRARGVIARPRLPR